MCQAIKLPSLVPVVPWRGSRSHMADTAGILAPWIENHSTHVYAQGPDGRRDTEIRMSRPCRSGEGRCCLFLAPSNQKRKTKNGPRASTYPNWKQCMFLRAAF